MKIDDRQGLHQQLSLVVQWRKDWVSAESRDGESVAIVGIGRHENLREGQDGDLDLDVLGLYVFWDFAQTVLVFYFILFYVDLYIFLDLWVWFLRGFNVDCVGIFCAKIDFEWV